MAFLLIIFAMAAIYGIADLAFVRHACAPPCDRCPHWDRCLSRHVRRVTPSRDPELCVLRWNGS